MCLYTKNIEPKVATKDIECIKYLYADGGKYVTPVRYVQVELDKELVASPSTPDLQSTGSDSVGDTIYALSGGAIHARLRPCGMTPHAFKAIIPKGTKYWVDTFGVEIAAEKMFISSKKADEVYNLPMAADILANAPQVNGVRVGDFLLPSGKFVHPNRLSKMRNPIGRVVGFHNDKPLIAALETFKGEIDTQWNSKLNKHIEREEAKKDFDGSKNTQSYINLTEKDKENRYNAYAKCANYDKEHNSYLPALGEMMEMLKNALYLNAAAFISGIGEILDNDRWYWTSSERSQRCSWFCGLGSRDVCCYWYYKRSTCRVVPFLASPEK